jgi:hypothetical protein
MERSHGWRDTKPLTTGRVWGFIFVTEIFEYYGFLFVVVVPCILITLKLFSPTNAPFY